MHLYIYLCIPVILYSKGACFFIGLRCDDSVHVSNYMITCCSSTFHSQKAWQAAKAEGEMKKKVLDTCQQSKVFFVSSESNQQNEFPLSSLICSSEDSIFLHHQVYIYRH